MSYWDRQRQLQKEWNEAEHPRGKTTPESTPGSFAPDSTDAEVARIANDALAEHLDDDTVGTGSASLPSSDPKLAEMEARLSSLKRTQAIYKQVNKIIRANKSGGAGAQVAALMEAGLTESQAHAFIKPDFMGRIGVPGFELTSINEKIKRVEGNMVQHKNLSAMAPVDTSTSSSGVRFEDDAAGNRIRLYFPGKPDDETRAALKRAGFKWAPTQGAWSGYRNYNSRFFAESLANK